MEVLKRIFECPKHNRNNCPVARKFFEIKGELPVPEAYLGNPKSKFMIMGINPGASENYLSLNFGEYLKQITQPLLPKYWQYHYVTEIFGYPPLKTGGGIVTNLVHCPTPSWTKQKEDKWQLSNVEKQKSIDLCSPFCFEIMEKINPELVLLHGHPAIEFFSNHYGWNVNENAKNQDINGVLKKGDGRRYVLAQHLRSMTWTKDGPKWKPFKDIANRLEKGSRKKPRI